MPEPSLSEISNISAEPERSGVAPVAVIDNRQMVNELSSNARFKAENDWRKYNEFLNNKKELFKNIGEIQGLEVAPQDRDVLKEQAADVLGTILKDPSVALGGRGYDELQGKIAKFKSDSMLSKQNKLDDDANELFMNRNPDLYTDENTALREGFWKQPLGSRQSVMLKMPTLLDEKGLFETGLKASTHDYTDVVGPDGKPGRGYIETGSETNPKAISELWNLALQGQKDKYGHSILGAVQKNFKELPEAEQKRYGSVENYFADKGQKYLKAYFPEGSYQQTPEGNYRFGKKLTADPNYLGAERLSLAEKALAEKTRYDKARIAVDWAEYGLKKDKLDDTDEEDLGGANTVLNEASSIINNATPKTIVGTKGEGEKTILRISDPTLLQSFGNIDKDGKTTNVPDAINFNPETNQPVLLYFRKKKPNDKSTGEYYDREIPLDQRTWLKHITKRSFPNKDIGKINQLLEDALKANNNSLYDLSKKVKAAQQPVAPEIVLPKSLQPKIKTTTKGVKIPIFVTK